MRTYEFYVKDINGISLKGKCAARTPTQLAIGLREQGLYLINYKLDKEKSKIFSKAIRILDSNRLSLKDIAYLCKQLSAILSAGITIAEALEILQEEAINIRLRNCLEKIQAMVYKGDSLSFSMKQLGNIFPEFMISMIAAGEYSGKLDIILKKLSIYYEKQYKIKSKIINALIYPSIVFIISIIVMIFIMTNIVPIFAQNLLSNGGRLPLITKFVLGISSFLTNKGYFLVLIIPLLSVIYLCIKDKSFYIRKKDKIKLQMPITNEIYIKLVSSKFASTLSMLISSGVSIVKTLDIVSQLVSNIIIREKLNLCISEINNGESLSSALKSSKVFPKLLCAMVKIGEETGSIEELLNKVSEIFEEEAYEGINKATILIEPVMICFLSVMVGVIIAATMLPMLNMMNVMGNY